MAAPFYSNRSVCYLKVGNLQGALSDVSDAIELLKPKSEANAKGDRHKGIPELIHGRRGRGFVTSIIIYPRTPAQKADLNCLILLFPELTKNHLRRGSILIRLGLHSKALGEFERAKETCPEELRAQHLGRGIDKDIQTLREKIKVN